MLGSWISYARNENNKTKLFRVFKIMLDKSRVI